MADERDANGELLPNNDRLTPLGKFVRAKSLYEFPPLIIFVKGDMALIGPCPLLTWFLPLYDETQIRRHEVPPGIRLRYSMPMLLATDTACDMGTIADDNGFGYC